MKHLKDILSKASNIAYSAKERNELESSIMDGYFNQKFEGLKNSLVAFKSNVENLDKISFFPNYIGEMLIFEEDLLSLKIFSMSSGTYFPIHDHPEMIGLIYLISGEISYSNYSILSQNSEKTYVKLVSNGNLRSSEFMTLAPKYQNLHKITATANSLLFDIFIPNYCSKKRPCTYYRQHSENELVKFSPELNFWEIPFEILN